MGLIDKIKQKARTSSATKGIEKQSYQIEKMKLARQEGIERARLESKRKMEKMKSGKTFMDSLMGSQTTPTRPRTIKRVVKRKPTRKIMRRSKPKPRIVRRSARRIPIKKENPLDIYKW